MAGLSPEQRDDAEKSLRYLKQMEGIIRTSPNAEQRARVSREIVKYREKLSALVPGKDFSKSNADQIRAELGLDAPGAAEGGAGRAGSAPSQAHSAVGGRATAGYSILQKFPVQKGSPNSSDPDVNFLSTVWNVINREYWPAISEQHCKLDFSHSSERDGLRAQLENISRNLKVLLETIEEYSGAEKQDFREQLLKMKNRQTRAFIFDSNEALKKLREFLEKLCDDVQSRGGVVMNKAEPLRFNARFEKATVLEGVSVADGLVEFHQFVAEAIQHLNLPQLKPPRTPGAPEA